MSRATNREVMGFFAIGEKHHEAILSLIQPSPYPDGRILDPFAGEGDFLLKASKTWGLAPYANELDKSRAEACIQKFGSENAVQGDVMRLSASLESFSIGWYNPPYDNDKLADTDETPEAKRVEYRYLRHAWKWIQYGGIVMWVVYRHHITESAATFLSRHSSSVDIWGLEGKHLGDYDQIIVVAIKGKHNNPQVLYDHIMATKDDPHPLTVLDKPVYQVPPPPTIARFVFAPDEVTPELGLKLIQERGAHLSARFNTLFAIPPTDEQIETIVPPRPGHMAYVLAGAATSGIVMETETYGKVAMRSVVKHVEERSDAVITHSGGEQVTITSKPKASITLLTQTGQIVNLSGDDALLEFIVKNKDRLIEFVKSRFTPLYEFDYAGFGRILDGIALVKGDKRYPLFTPQKHVVGAILRGFQERRGIFLVGQMSTGKASRNSARVYTPDGYKLMGDIQVGDKVINPEGGYATVLGVFPQGEVDIYRVTMIDGSYTDVTLDHLWEVNTPFRKWNGQPSRVKSLREIVSKPLAHRNGNFQHFIPMVKPIEFNEREVPLDPYLLGVLLGDGCLRANSVSFSSPDEEIIEAVTRLLPAGVKCVYKGKYDYGLTVGRNKSFVNPNPLLNILRKLGLAGKKSKDKFIPEEYLYNSIENRLALLQGLLDTDGHASWRCGVEYSTVSPMLARQVKELAESLGASVKLCDRYTFYTHNGEYRRGQKSYRVSITFPKDIQPFRLSRKLARFDPPENHTPTRSIVDVQYVGKDEATCILLDSANHLYVTDDYIVTHNTLMGGTVASIIGSGAHPTFRKHIARGGVVVIVCPPHLVSKWKREILGINPKCIIHQVNRHEDMKAFMDVPHQLGHPKIAIIKRDMTKLGSGWRESVVWRKHPYALWKYNLGLGLIRRKKRKSIKRWGYTHKRLLFHRTHEPLRYDTRRPIDIDKDTPRVYTVEKPHCPHCHAVLTSEEDIRTKEEFITYLQASKRECPNCHSPLWQEIREPNTLQDGKIVKNPRYRLDQYIKKRYRRDIALLIWDEVHEAQHSDTGNGEAFGRLANCARATLAMTGTPFNGYASSLFNLEYILNPRVRREYYWGGAVRYTRKRRGSKDYPSAKSDAKTTRGQQESRWVAQMGVRERIETTVKEYSSAGKLTGTETYVRPYEETSGISPMLVSTMLDHTIYFSLSDLKKHLPMYSETTYAVDMDASMEGEYEDVVDKLLDRLIAEKHEPASSKDNTILPKYLQFTMGWVNAPWRDYRIQDKWGDEIARALPQDYQPSDMSDKDWFVYGGDELSPKEEAFVEYVQEELEAGRPCIVYCRQTQKNDIQIRLQHLIHSRLSANTYILRSSINAERREAVIDKQIGQGMEILICNPEIVKTGLDLVFAPTIIFYEPTFNLSTMMQAAARSYRLNQTFPLCRVVYMYYRGTMEERAILLMSKKQRSSKLLTGDTGLSGLDALTEKEDKFESVLMNSIGKDERLEAPDFTQENSRYAEFDSADLAYWNVETVTPPAETPIRYVQVLNIAQKAVEQVIAMRGMTAPKPAHYNSHREQIIGNDGDKTIVQLRLF